VFAVNGSPPELRQVCWLVPDLDAAIERWVETTGAGPFYVMRHVELENVTHRGQPSSYDHSAAIGQWGPIQIELQQKHCDTPSITSEMFAPGETGIHHYNWWVADVDAEIQRMEALGFETVFTTGIGTTMYTAWFDARPLFGALIEIYADSPFVREVGRIIQDASTDWDGVDPVRPFAGLVEAMS
jgi:catechol 2,3-dioxygenase-like lactoylglutathione lyase family enzyme